MQKFSRIFCTIAVFTVVLALILPSAAFAQSPTINLAPEGAAVSGTGPLRLNVSAESGHKVHVMPTHAQVKD